MIADVASPAPASTTSDSIFDEHWKSFGGDNANDYENLDDLNLDDVFGPPPKNEPAMATVNPQVLSGAAPMKKHLDPGRSSKGSPQEGDDDNVVVGPAPKAEEFEQRSALSPPILYHSIESPNSTFDFHTPTLNNQLHRRSVSEPPTGMLSDHIYTFGTPAIPDPPMVFTRSGVHLGTPKVHHGNRLTRSKHPYIQEPYSMQKPHPHERYHLRRSQTQPFRSGPTSVPPRMQPMHHIPPPAMMTQQQHVPRPIQVNAPAVTSRVCTPAPSPPQLRQMSPGQIDCRRIDSPAVEETKRMVSIPLTVEELRGMITEAVKAAMSAAKVGNSVDGDDGQNAARVLKGE